MLERESGTIIVTGNTAAERGKGGWGFFAATKAAALVAAKKPQPPFPLSAAVLPVTIIVPLSRSNIFGRVICDKISNAVVLTLKFFSKSW